MPAITMRSSTLSFLIVFIPSALGWVQNLRHVRPQAASTTSLSMAAVGIFYGTREGATEECAQKIYQALGPHIAAEPVDIDSVGEDIGEEFRKHQALVVGVPTWKTDAATERSGTGWDSLYYIKLPWLADSLQGKKVAVFGLGDQQKYPGNFADAAGELFDTFAGCGCLMFGSWEETGYMHYASKSVREFGGYKKFCGLILDVTTQKEMTDDRVQQWVAQLAAEGFFEPRPPPGAAGVAEAPPPAGNVAPPNEPDTNADHSDLSMERSESQSSFVSSDSMSGTNEAEFPAADDYETADDYYDDGEEDEEDDELSKAIKDAEARLAELEKEKAALREFLKKKQEQEAEEERAREALKIWFPHYNSLNDETLWTSGDGKMSFVTSGDPTASAASEDGGAETELRP